MRNAMGMFALGLMCFCFAGCGPDTGGRLPVSGTITLKGAPLDEGSIRFESKPPATGVFTGGTIINGQYSLTGDQGLPAGTYIVRISAPEKTAPVEEIGGEFAPPVQDRVPAQYNVKSELTFEVKEGATNQFNFDVP